MRVTKAEQSEAKIVRRCRKERLHKQKSQSLRGYNSFILSVFFGSTLLKPEKKSGKPSFVMLQKTLVHTGTLTNIIALILIRYTETSLLAICTKMCGLLVESCKHGAKCNVFLTMYIRLVDKRCQHEAPPLESAMKY